MKKQSEITNDNRPPTNADEDGIVTVKLHDLVPPEEQARTEALRAKYRETHAEGEIDFSDIPPLDENFWRNAKLLSPKKEAISIRLDEEVLAYFRESGPGYQGRINAILRAYVQTKLQERDKA